MLFQSDSKNKLNVIFSPILFYRQAVYLSSSDVLPPEPTANVTTVVTIAQSQKTIILVNGGDGDHGIDLITGILSKTAKMFQRNGQKKDTTSRWTFAIETF